MGKKLFLLGAAAVLLIGTFLGIIIFVGNEPIQEEASDTPPEPITLVMYGIFDKEEIYRPLIEQYQSENPNITIKYYKVNDDPDTYEEFLINEIADGEGPDIFALKNTWISKHRSKTAPLSISEESNFLTPTDFTEKFVQTVSQDLLSENEVGTFVYGIPLYVDSLAIFYNRAYLAQDIPSRGTPASTWEQLRQEAPLLTRENNSIERFATSAIALGRADNISRAPEILITIMKQNKTNFYNPANTGSSIAELHEGSTRPGAESLKFYTSFANASNSNYTWNETITLSHPSKELAAFLRGKVSMIIGYSYYYETLSNLHTEMEETENSLIPISDIATAPLPQWSSEDSPQTYASYFFYTVNKNSNHKSAAWKFLLYLAEEDNLREYYTQTNLPTSSRALTEQQMTDPIYGTFAEQATYAKTYDLKDEEFFLSNLSAAIQEVTRGREIAQNALEEFQNKLSEHMKFLRELENLSAN